MEHSSSHDNQPPSPPPPNPPPPPQSTMSSSSSSPSPPDISSFPPPPITEMATPQMEKNHGTCHFFCKFLHNDQCHERMILHWSSSTWYHHSSQPVCSSIKNKVVPWAYRGAYWLVLVFDHILTFWLLLAEVAADAEDAESRPTMEGTIINTLKLVLIIFKK